jgi:hypothetical protein
LVADMFADTILWRILSVRLYAARGEGYVFWASEEREGLSGACLTKSCVL